MPRKLSQISLMRKAARERDIEGFLWAALSQSAYEIKVKSEGPTFAPREIQNIINNIVSLEKIKMKTEAPGSDDLSKHIAQEVEDWLKLTENS
jgi:hypothetical protein